MPKTKRVAELGRIAHEDMLYAINCLIESGKTTALEVTRLAGNRGDRIAALKAELAALEGGKPVVLTPAAAPAKRAYRRKATPAPKPTAKTAPPKGTKKAVGSKIIRKDGRSFTNTAKVVRSRKLQGQYLGNLRKVPENERDGFKQLARSKGVPVALAAIKKRLGTS